MRKMTIVAGLACILSAPAQCFAKAEGVYAEAGDTVESEWTTPICAFSRDLYVAQQFLIAKQIDALKGLDCTTLTVSDKVTVLSKFHGDSSQARVMFEYTRGKYLQGYVNLSHFTSEKTKPLAAIAVYEFCLGDKVKEKAATMCAHLEPAPGYAECRSRLREPLKKDSCSTWATGAYYNICRATENPLNSRYDCEHLVTAPGTK